MSRARRIGFVLALVLFAGPVCFAPDRSPRPLGLLTPFAELAAELQWVRFEGALTRGEEARALALAESALALAPRITAGWKHLAAHQGYELASPLVEPDPALRAAWLASAEATLARGLELVDEPADLALFHALLLHSKAATDPTLAPGGAQEFLARARERMTVAALLGSPEAQALLSE
jgi:hypothetical protein